MARNSPRALFLLQHNHISIFFLTIYKEVYVTVYTGTRYNISDQLVHKILHPDTCTNTKMLACKFAVLLVFFILENHYFPIILSIHVVEDINQSETACMHCWWHPPIRNYRFLEIISNLWVRINNAIMVRTWKERDKDTSMFGVIWCIV